MPITLYDSLFFLVVIVSSGFAFYRGLIRELLSLIIYILSAMLSYILWQLVLPLLQGESSHDAFIRFSTLLVIFISFCTLFSYIGTYLATKIHLIFKTKVNQIGGIIYGILRGIFVMVLFTLLFEAYPQEGWFSHALVKPFLDTIGAKLLQIIPSGSIYILYEIFNGTS